MNYKGCILYAMDLRMVKIVDFVFCFLLFMNDIGKL